MLQVQELSTGANLDVMPHSNMPDLATDRSVVTEAIAPILLTNGTHVLNYDGERVRATGIRVLVYNGTLPTGGPLLSVDEAHMIVVDEPSIAENIESAPVVLVSTTPRAVERTTETTNEVSETTTTLPVVKENVAKDFSMNGEVTRERHANGSETVWIRPNYPLCAYTMHVNASDGPQVRTLAPCRTSRR